MLGRHIGKFNESARYIRAAAAKFSVKYTANSRVLYKILSCRTKECNYKAFSRAFSLSLPPPPSPITFYTVSATFSNKLSRKFL